MIFSGRNLVKYPYSCYGYTRGGSKPWHRRIIMRWMPRTAKQTSLTRMPKQLVKEGFSRLTNRKDNKS